MATSKDSGQGGSKQSGSQGGQQSDTSKRGFASMDPAQQREIASEGGRAAHEKGTAHEFTSEEARRAGSMSHKNDAGSSQSSTSGSRSGGKDKDEDDDKQRSAGQSGSQSGSRSGGSGGSGGGSSKS